MLFSQGPAASAGLLLLLVTACTGTSTAVLAPAATCLHLLFVLPFILACSPHLQMPPDTMRTASSITHLALRSPALPRNPNDD